MPTLLSEPRTIFEILPLLRSLKCFAKSYDCFSNSFSSSTPRSVLIRCHHPQNMSHFTQDGQNLGNRLLAILGFFSARFARQQHRTALHLLHASSHITIHPHIGASNSVVSGISDDASVARFPPVATWRCLKSTQPPSALLLQCKSSKPQHFGSTTVCGRDQSKLTQDAATILSTASLLNLVRRSLGRWCAESAWKIRAESSSNGSSKPPSDKSSTLRAHQMAVPGQRRTNSPRWELIKWLCPGQRCSARDSKSARGQGGSLCSQILD